MQLRAIKIMMVLWLCLGCEGNERLIDLSDEAVNNILSLVDTDNPEFVKKGVVFDSILTVAGTREMAGELERIKCKFFFYGENVRGYFNLTDRDDKNLQIFGKCSSGQLAFKAATKINMEESDGYIILDSDYNGIWSNGKVNFVKGKITLDKKDTDYNSLSEW